MVAIEWNASLECLHLLLDLSPLSVIHKKNFDCDAYMNQSSMDTFDALHSEGAHKGKETTSSWNLVSIGATHLPSHPSLFH